MGRLLRSSLIEAMTSLGWIRSEMELHRLVRPIRNWTRTLDRRTTICDQSTGPSTPLSVWKSWNTSIIRGNTRRACTIFWNGGVALITTPYHGYWKNLALALTGTMDDHFTALWTHGHIKFWSRGTLGQLLDEAGFENIRFHRVGRIPPLAKSMIAVAEKPGRWLKMLERRSRLRALK